MELLYIEGHVLKPALSFRIPRKILTEKCIGGIMAGHEHSWNSVGTVLEISGDISWDSSTKLWMAKNGKEEV